MVIVQGCHFSGFSWKSFFYLIPSHMKISAFGLSKLVACGLFQSWPLLCLRTDHVSQSLAFSCFFCSHSKEQCNYCSADHILCICIN